MIASAMDRWGSRPKVVVDQNEELSVVGHQRVGAGNQGVLPLLVKTTLQRESAQYVLGPSNRSPSFIST
jgi:hypothetical protein